ncbi:hydantoinase/oxoprolinase family protein [Dehalobacterium formicoaceticum]|uniref:hydantoinase/oxoprolinase family protein n=1 Tax=Dehalobacterium formicoaceticum TaxID=51515 RepID=UPI000B7DEA69|nr:hydantoinase/oxoprolinase family protein [Dehalobacterium formicoaceticum]
MSFILGIDTGGTYTDGVIVAMDEKKVLNKAKALTTREDLTIGIRNCIDNMKFEEFDKISVVSLSTTLATNATVEGRGCPVGLLLIGHDPVDKMPVQCYEVLKGGHNIHGLSLDDLDEGEIRQKVLSFKGKVEAVAISGYLSVRNPEHELRVKEIVEELLDLPVVCAHQLTTTLGFHERTVTAALNARLIPIIAELMESVKIVLKEKNIEASLMIVKGDGSLMGEKMARQKPIDTILSGPASSIIGGTFLSDTQNGLVFDMGGTTTDIALLKNGVPHINQEGAMVGGWLTRVQAAEIYTYGLGGDSYLQLTQGGNLLVGPQRVWPLSVVASQHPNLLHELSTYFDRNYSLMFAQATDCFMMLKKPTGQVLDETERKIIEILEKGPRSLYYLAYALRIDPNLFSTHNLVNLGIVAKISMTPTDILHAQGIYTQWSREAAEKGADILAYRMRKSREEFLEIASERIVNELCLTCVQSLITSEDESLWFKDSETAMYFADKALAPKKNQLLGFSFQMEMPIVGIGAPVQAWLPRVAEKMHTELIIPDHAEVANAIGAATGKIMETVKVLIKPGENNRNYFVHAPWERRVFKTLKRAKIYALNEAKKRAKLAAEQAGAGDYELLINDEDVYAPTNIVEDDIYIESRIEVTAVGRPEW